MSNGSMTRILGGSPLAVLARLVLVSVLVGVDSVRGRARSLQHHTLGRAAGARDLEHGLGRGRYLWRYFLLGAVIVIPIWIIVRLVNAPRGK